jgi:hypothetical protein
MYAYVHANSAYSAVNALALIAGNSNTANTAWIHANAAFDHANAAFAAANLASGVDTSSFASAAYANTRIFAHANSAYAHANTVQGNLETHIQNYDDQIALWDPVLYTANIAAANAYSHANGSFAATNTLASYANSTFAAATYANTRIFAHANGAFAALNTHATFANTAYVLKAGDTISGNLIISGQLTVIGPTVAIANLATDIVFANVGIFSQAVTINGNTAWHAGNDGAGSALDADLVDGLQAISFANATHANAYFASAAYVNSTFISTATADTKYANATHANAYFASASYANSYFASASYANTRIFAHANSAYDFANIAVQSANAEIVVLRNDLANTTANALGAFAQANIANSRLTAANVLSLLITVDGAGSGLDADLLDGLTSASFANATHTNATFIATTTADTKYANATHANASFYLKTGGLISGSMTATGNVSTSNNVIFVGETGNKLIWTDTTSGGVPVGGGAGSGTRIVLRSKEAANTVDYSIGFQTIGADYGIMWYTVPKSANNFAHKFYANGTTIVAMYGDGNMHVEGGGVYIPGDKNFVVGSNNVIHSATLLSNILNVDGSGSGIDADKVDGLEASSFANATHANANFLSLTTTANQAISSSNITFNKLVQFSDNVAIGSSPPVLLPAYTGLSISGQNGSFVGVTSTLSTVVGQFAASGESSAVVMGANSNHPVIVVSAGTPALFLSNTSAVLYGNTQIVGATKTGAAGGILTKSATLANGSSISFTNADGDTAAGMLLIRDMTAAGVVMLIIDPALTTIDIVSDVSSRYGANKWEVTFAYPTVTITNAWGSVRSLTATMYALSGPLLS